MGDAMKRADILGLAARAGLLALIMAGNSAAALADEGGVSFWLPGTFGSLAAAPSTPGWSWATPYLHSDVASGAGVQSRVVGESM
jgi:hypothetical protein